MAFGHKQPTVGVNDKTFVYINKFSIFFSGTVDNDSDNAFKSPIISRILILISIFYENANISNFDDFFTNFLKFLVKFQFKQLRLHKWTE